jgi:putative hydrolase of the HAD superfamily
MPLVIAFDIDGTLVDLLPAIHASFLGVRETSMALYADAAPGLAALRGRYVLGLGSNGSSHASRCGLGGTFAFEVYAHVDGVPPKPNPRFFERLVEAAGAVVGGGVVVAGDMEPHEIVYVGDSLDDDVVPAAAAGLRTVWLNRSGSPVPADLRCDAVIETLTQLPGAVEALAPLVPLER